MLDPNLTVARTVRDHSETASVFQRHRIDYCCKGGISIHAAAAERGVDVVKLLSELEGAIAARQGDGGTEPATLPTPELIGYIVSTHHDYLRKTMPFVRALAAKVARVHGEHDPRLLRLHALVDEICDTLDPHLDAEEQELFPALLQRTPDRRRVREELETMHADHLVVGQLLSTVRDQTGDFALPEWACTSYRTLFAELERLEADILRHVHLENHVLMPRFVES